MLQDVFMRMTSRKFILAVLGSLTVFNVPLTTEQLAAVTLIVLAFIGVEGTADIMERS